MEKVNLAAKFALFSDHWSPKIAGELNDSYVKLAKVQGEFFWHRHADEDEMFLIHKGTLTLRLRGGDVILHPGEFYIVPKGVEHCPYAEEEVEMLLLEPKTTLNSGNVVNERTVAQLERILTET